MSRAASVCCHVIAKLIFVAFNKHAEIPVNSNQLGSCNQALSLSIASSELKLNIKRVRDCCECFVFKYTHLLTVQ